MKTVYPNSIILFFAQAALVIGIIPVTGCNIQRMALDQTAAILKQTTPALESESDYEFAVAALPASIKTFEGFLQSGKDNANLLELTAMGYASYGMVALEDQWERAEDMSDEADILAKRTRGMYMRAHGYGLQLIELNHPGFTAAYKKGRDHLDRALKRLSRKDLPGLLWSAMPLFMAVNVSRDDVTMIAKLPQAKALVVRLVELDPAFYNAAGHMILGSMYGSVGKMMGGDPVKSKKHFEQALKLTKRRFLLVQVMYAQTLAVQVQDRALFTKLLQEVKAAKLSIYPRQSLANVLAKRKAGRLVAKADEFF
jgi:hypothetical protein